MKTYSKCNREERSIYLCEDEDSLTETQKPRRSCAVVEMLKKKRSGEEVSVTVNIRDEEIEREPEETRPK